MEENSNQNQQIVLSVSATQDYLTIDHLELYHLEALIRGDVLALRWPNFYDQQTSLTIADRLLSHPLRSCYENGPQIGRIGMAYFEAESQDAKDRYYAQANDSIWTLRNACRPYANPIDILRLVLEEVWPGGAKLEEIEGKKMFAGIIRIFETGSQARAHQDILEWDAPANCTSAKELLTQLTANIYLQPTTEGGNLELWNIGLTKQQYNELRIPGTYVVDRNKLPKSVLITPQLGELILFNATKVHAVTPIKQGTRVTASCFIGVRGKMLPLSFWS